jgi:hypothetical protein
MDIEAPNFHFEEVDLHIEEILVESNIFNDNVLHYFVEIEGSNCDPPFEANNPCLSGNGNCSHPSLQLEESTYSCAIASKTLFLHFNHIGQFATLLEAPSRSKRKGATKELLIAY